VACAPLLPPKGIGTLSETEKEENEKKKTENERKKEGNKGRKLA